MPAKKKKASGDATKGEKIFKNVCAVCHSFKANATGPSLKAISGREPAIMEGFSYSGALLDLKGKKWTDSNLDKYLKSPIDYAPGNAMAFAGLPN